MDEETVLTYVRGIRARQPRMGTRKLHALLGGVMRESGIRMGRDRLFGVLRDHGMLVEPRRKRARKVMGYHVHETLETKGPLRALQIALNNRDYRGTEFIHHSD